MLDIAEHADQDGSSPFARWFSELDAHAAAKVTVSLARLAQGNTSNVKRLQAGVLELKIDFGPGYRVYFGREGKRLVILLGGGTKKRQQRDIENAVSRWADYRKRLAGKV
jgi:putative addiction module killer protein